MNNDLNLDGKYFLENQSEFRLIGREHDCEIPKGDLWGMTVKHIETGVLYRYYYEDVYKNLSDQVSDLGLDSIDFKRVLDIPVNPENAVVRYVVRDNNGEYKGSSRYSWCTEFDNARVYVKKNTAQAIANRHKANVLKCELRVISDE